ncbi:MAG: aminotransferase class III-fold pyridoxal phosphate-dependent enzyme, partial [Candidatus Dormibacteraeota bacterium]|nr:aminotransferase class III-fold pyridoxal phosphate-dependent enzyme [Candidatus Dormibacteraeota bacterium]
MPTVLPDRWLQQIASHTVRGVRIMRADGPHVWDEDGNKLVDLSGDDGNALIGYRHPAVVRAVDEAVRRDSGVHAA